VIISLARRVAGPEDLERPGDYCGPLAELGVPGLEPTGRTAVWVVPLAGPAVARLVSPPWVLTEQEDGTLRVEAPVTARAGDSSTVAAPSPT
jgi:hypothetical protein